MSGLDSSISIPPQPQITAAEIAKVAALKGQLMRVRRRDRDTRQLANWPRSIGERNPLFLSEEYGRRSCHGTLIAHPCWLYTVHPSVVAPGLSGVHNIIARSRWNFVRPVRPGDTVVPEVRLLDVRERTGRFAGRFVEQIGHVRYHDGNGREFATAETTTFRIERDAARRIAKYQNRTRHRWTSEELARVEAAYDAEEIRGMVPRYWEDVRVGDELTPVVKGPLAPTDMEAFVPTVTPVKPFSYWLEEIDRHPAVAFVADGAGWPDSWDRSYLDRNVARLFGFPDAHDCGLDRIAWCASLLTNWAGDHGSLRSLDVRLTLPNIHRDATWCFGRVDRAWTDGVRALVSVELWCENQLGEITARGSAHVELPSRTVTTTPSD